MKHEAEMAKLKALKAKRDAKHSNAVDKAKKLLEAHRLKVEADKKAAAAAA